MSKFQPVIKWSGSKRSQSENIVREFPQEIDTYYEPFCGGSSVLMELLCCVEEGNKNVNRYVVSDINKELIMLWDMIKECPEELISYYSKLWGEMNMLSEEGLKVLYYNGVRRKT